MDIVRDINRSRGVLKEYLQNEWDTSVIQDLSDREIEIMYTAKSPKNAMLSSLGQAVGCNLTLEHAYLKGHYLHVIYFNFPKFGDPPTKITKTCKDKIQKLYDSDEISKEDSLLVIIMQPVSETISAAIEELYSQGQMTLLVEGVDPDLLATNDALEERLRLSQRHFRNIQIFQLAHVTINIMKHRLVPRQECVRDELTIQEILQECNASPSQLPIIKRYDPQAKVMRMCPGDICKLHRNTTAGDVRAYRICQ